VEKLSLVPLVLAPLLGANLGERYNENWQEQ